jgi:hypothetical protein
MNQTRAETLENGINKGFKPIKNGYTQIVVG